MHILGIRIEVYRTCLILEILRNWHSDFAKKLGRIESFISNETTIRFIGNHLEKPNKFR